MDFLAAEDIPFRKGAGVRGRGWHGGAGGATTHQHNSRNVRKRMHIIRVISTYV